MDMATDLKNRWTAYKQQNPNVRIRNAAKDLDTSEAALVATGIGETAVRLDGDWGELIQRFPALGKVLCITRNNYAVHEKTGEFDKISIGPGHGIVLNVEIDLRLFLSQWHFGFAVTEQTQRGERKSFQFFNIDGESVHKVYMVDDSDLTVYNQLVDDFRADDQSPDLKTVPLPPEVAPRPDGDIDVQTMRAHWEALQDTHDFIELLRTFDVRRLQALRLVGEDLAYQVPVETFKHALETAAERQTSIMVFVGSKGCIQIHTGPVSNVKDMHGWTNVLDPGFDLHVKLDEIDQAWVVRKPTRDGIVTSLELYDASGKEVLYMFGERKPGEAERTDWQHLVADLTKEAA